MPDESIYTTGDVARLCGVSQRAIIRWCEIGLKHWIIPGSRARRIVRRDLLTFLRESDCLPLLRTVCPECRHVAYIGMDARVVTDASYLLGDSYCLVGTQNWFDLGCLVVAESFQLIILDFCEGREIALHAAKRLFTQYPTPVLAVAFEDDGNFRRQKEAKIFARVLNHPITAPALAEAIKELAN